MSFQVSVTTERGKVDIIEVEEVSEKVKNLTVPSTTRSLSTADIDFTAKLLLDLATATSVSGDTSQERGVEKNVRQIAFELNIEKQYPNLNNVKIELYRTFNLYSILKKRTKA